MELKETVKILKALADESRLLIANALLQKPCYVEELSQRLNLSMSTVSFHLKKLEQANLVYKEKQQYYVMYYAAKPMFFITLENLIGFNNPQKQKEEERMDRYIQKVIATFFENGRLIKLPTQHKKRIIVLEVIASTFDKSHDYQEAQVNELITFIYDDYCTIRRLLVDEGFMVRAGDRYRLVKTELEDDEIREEPLTLQDITQHVKTENGHTMKDTKKELKRQYLDNPPPMGVFQIRNTKNNKVFIGCSENLPGMLNRYRFQLKLGSHRNKDLQSDWNEFGQDAFVFEILDVLEPKTDPDWNSEKDLLELKELWLEKLNPYDEFGYNKHTNLQNKKHL